MNRRPAWISEEAAARELEMAKQPARSGPLQRGAHAQVPHPVGHTGTAGISTGVYELFWTKPPPACKQQLVVGEKLNGTYFLLI